MISDARFSVRANACITTGPIIAVTIDIVFCTRMTVADASGTTATPTTTTVHEGLRPTAATATATDRPEPASQGPSGVPTLQSGRRPRRRNAPLSPTSTTRVAEPVEDDAAEFPVTFKSADLFVVTKTKLYSTFSISMKVCKVIHLIIKSSLTLSPPIPLRLYTLPYWSNTPFFYFWHSGALALRNEH